MVDDGRYLFDSVDEFLKALLLLLRQHEGRIDVLHQENGCESTAPASEHATCAHPTDLVRILIHHDTKDREREWDQNQVDTHVQTVLHDPKKYQRFDSALPRHKVPEHAEEVC